MEQLRYAVMDIKRHPMAFFIFFIQIFVTLVLVAMMTVTAVNAKKYEKRLTALTDLESSYLLRNTSDMARVEALINTPGIEKPLYELYSYIHNIAPESYSFYNYAIYLGNYEHMEALHVDENFLKVFSFQIKEGRTLSGKDFEKSDKTPLLLGASYQKDYHIGDAVGENFFVVGFLEKNVFYLDPLGGNEFLPVDQLAVVPIVFDSASDYAELHMAIDSTCVITDNKEDLEKIRYKSAELKLFSYNYDSYQSQLDYIIEEAEQYISLELTIAGLIFLFCLINIITELLHFIGSHKKEFAVHFLCGGTVVTFLQRIAWQVLSVLLLSEGLVALLFHNWVVLGVLTGVNVLFAAIILGVPIFQLLTQDMNEILKRSE